MTKYFLIPAIAIGLGTACSEPRMTDEQFLACWGGRPGPDRTTRIQFEAVVYPRAGVLSVSNACRGPLLRLQFDNNLPRVFFDLERAGGLEPRGLRGMALVSVVAREAPNVMSVRVRHVIQAEVLSETESRSAVERLEGSP